MDPGQTAPSSLIWFYSILHDFKVVLVFSDIESNTHAPVLLNLSISLRKSDKMLCKSGI